MRLNLLLSSAGRRVELLQLFRAAADGLGVDLTVVAVDSAPTMSAACQFADWFETVPQVHDPGYADAVMDVCARHEISICVPLIDPDVTAWSLLEPRVRIELGVRVAVSAADTVAICRNKQRTAEVLRQGGLSVPRTWSGKDFDPHQPGIRWPLICKPSAGSSSAGVRVFNSPGEARLDPATASDVVQEKVAGQEITVNVFYARDGRVLYAIPHERLEIRSGEVAKGVTVRHAAVGRAAVRMAELLPGLWGPICFQGILQPDGSLSIFEINARFGGGYPLAHAAGARGPQYLLLDALGQPLEPIESYVQRLTMLRYDQSVFTTDGSAR